VDLSCDVAGRFAAKLFAMAGVEVLRPGKPPDPADVLGVYLDHGKTHLADVADRLAEADLVFVSFDRGEVQGAGRELAGGIAADAVLVTTSAFGAQGPYSGWRGGPAAAWAAGGYLAITGEPDRAPLMGPERLCGYVAGYSAAIAAEAALFRRRRTGQGCHIDLGEMEAMLGVHQSTFSRLGAGEVRGRTGRIAELYPLTVLPCADGHVALGVATDREFDLLCAAAGCPELLADARFATGHARLAAIEAVDAALAPFLQSHAADEVVAILQAAGVPTAKVADPLQVLENPQLAHRGFFVEAPGGGRMPGAPIPKAKVFAAPAPPRPADPAVWPLRAEPRPPLPLAGVRVLDLTNWWAGPSATRTLADLGADVIWIEKPNSRAAWTDYEGAWGDSLQLYEWKMFRSKRSVVLDLATEPGRAAARRLAAQADVLVENFRPGVVERLGLGPKALAELNPGLVCVSLSGFGAEGPWSRWGSYGPNIEAASSIMARTGYEGGAPLRLGHTLPDGVGGLAGALAALRGLREREARGGGGWYDISQLEAYAAISGEEILAASRAGAWAGRNGSRSRQGAFQGVFPCRGEDQWIAIRLEGAQDARRLRQLVGRAPNEAAIAGWTSGQDKFELTRTLQAAGLEAFPALTAPELAADPNLAVRGFFIAVEAGGVRHPMPGHPYRADPPLADSRGAVPMLGEHTAELLKPPAERPLGHPGG
jgi:crotonobetainyl-CoA:carnitine CoA-transferase CaiB-like acyl-CoA transferase